MNNCIKVTIGIPFYNSAAYLASAIRSVLNQSFIDFELLLTDDGSTDNSLAIAKSFGDYRIRIISDGENRGISYRLNQQIALAQGRYFARMDADDIMFSDRIQKQFDYLEQNSEIDVVGSQAIVIDDENCIIGLRSPAYQFNMLDVLQHPVFIHPTVMGKTEWFRKFGYVDNLKGVEDYDLWVRSFSQSHFDIMREPLLFYRDPLKLKLSVYLFRNRQIRRSYINNRKYINSLWLLWQLKFKSYVKCMLYSIFTVFKVDYLLVRKRNKLLSEKMKTTYNSELIYILKNEL